MTDTRRSVYSGPAATATCPNCGSVQSGGLTACAKCGAALPVVTASNITPGMIIDGKYEIIGLLGVGGMGEVFKARHIHLNAFRCVKVMKRNLVADESFRNRFLREARVATHVHHANLAVVHDFASLPDGSYYMVSEFVDGITVRQWAGRYGRFGAELAIEIMLQVLSGLEHCHRKGLLHRDISADNIMIEFDDQGHPQAKIIDLGIAKIVSAPASDATQVGLFVGNPKYSSPEQLGHLPDGEEIDGRTDLYSLGVVVYEMLVGVPPFSSKTPHGYVIKHLTQPPIPLREANPTLEWPTGLQEVIFKALEKDRKNRYADAREFAKALRPFGSDQLVHWFPPEGAEPYGTSQVDQQTQIGTDAAMKRAIGTPIPAASSSPPTIADSGSAPTVSDVKLIEAMGATRTVAEPPAGRAKKDDADFADAEKVGSIEAYHGYLQIHPNGRSVRMAELRIEELTLIETIEDLEKRRQLGELDVLVSSHSADTRMGKAARGARARVRERIAQEAKEESSAWESALEKGTSEAFAEFLAKYPESDRHDEAELELAEVQSFEAALQSGTEARWKEYLVEFPEGRHRPQAESHLQLAKKQGQVEAAFARAVAADTAQALREFVAAFAGTTREQEAKRRLAERTAFETAAKLNSEDAWEDYLVEWPGDPHADAVRKNLAALRQREEQAYNASIAKATSKALQSFLKDFPASKRKAAVEQQLAELTAFEQAAKQGPKGWEEFLRKYASGPLADRARSTLDETLEKEAFERGARENKIEVWREYLAKHAHSPRAQEASARFEELAYRQAIDSKDVKKAEEFLDDFPTSGRALEMRRLKEQWTVEKALREALAAIEKGDEGPAKKLLPTLSDPSHKRQIENAIESVHDRADWAAASKNITAESLRNYLNAHPSGQWAAIATTNLEEFSLLDQIPQFEAARQLEPLEKLARNYGADNRVGKAARASAKKVRDQLAKQKPAVAVATGTSDFVPTAAPRAGSPKALIAIGAVAVVAIAIIAVLLTTGSEETAPTTQANAAAAPIVTPKPPAGSGIVVIDALPWGEVNSVKDSTGREWLKETDRYTPLALTVPPGKYTIAVSNPNFPRRPLALSADVVNGQVINAVGEFQEVDAKVFFDKAGFR